MIKISNDLNDIEEQYKKTNKESKIKDNDNYFEEMGQSNTKEELIEKKKKKKSNKKDIKKLNKKMMIFLVINITIFLIIYIFYLSFFKSININKDEYEISKNVKSENKLPLIGLKMKKEINYTNEESKFNVDRKKFPTESVSEFPCGNIISVDWISILIYDKNYNIIQRIYIFEGIDKLHYFKTQKRLYKVVVKDDINFAVYADDGSLRIFNKQGNQFVLKQEIKDVKVYDITFDSKGRIIAGCRENMIKVFELNEKGNYQSKKSIINADAFHVKLLEDKNILISKEIASLQFYDISQNYKLIETLKERSIHEFERIDDDKVILYHNNYLKILSVKERKVIKKIEIGFEAYSIQYYKEKGIILLGGTIRNKGSDKSILSIYKSDNFELLKSIEDIHGSCIKGIYIFKNGLIATFANDQEQGYTIKIWSLE